MPDILQKYTNFSGETYEQPAEQNYIIKNSFGKSLDITICGIDDSDCLMTFERRKEEFKQTNGVVHIWAGTPRLAEYNRQKKEKKSA